MRWLQTLRTVIVINKLTEVLRTLTVIGEDRPGLLTEITELLAAEKIDLRDFSADSVGSTVIFKLIPVPYERAFNLLDAAGYQLIANRNILVRLADEPGALAKLSRRLSDAGVQSRGIHIIDHCGDASLVAIETTNRESVCEALTDILV